MVFTLMPLSFTIAEHTSTAISDAGILSSFLGQSISTASDSRPMIRACQLSVPIERPISVSLSTVSIGELPNVSPRKSLTCPTTIVTAIPNVKPAVIVPGIYFIRLPKRQSPIIIIIMPAITVDMTSPDIPSLATMPATIVAKAAVGPAI